MEEKSESSGGTDGFERAPDQLLIGKVLGIAGAAADQVGVWAIMLALLATVGLTAASAGSRRGGAPYGFAILIHSISSCSLFLDFSYSRRSMRPLARQRNPASVNAAGRVSSHPTSCYSIWIT